MPVTQLREIAPAARLENVRYAIRDLACIADEVARQGHKILPLNIGDPLNFDFQTVSYTHLDVYKRQRYFCSFADAVVRSSSASLSSCDGTVNPLQ